MSGSSPDPLASSASGGTWLGLTPSRAAAAARREMMSPIRTLFSAPRLDAPLEVGSYPVPAADGRLWKYLGSGATTGLPEASLVGWPFFRTGTVKLWPIREEPTALWPKATWAKPVMASG